MSKYANPGELRTPVYFKKVSDRGSDAEGYPTGSEVNIFGEGVAVRVKWVNLHGTEVLTGLQLQLKEPATITMRYSPLINKKLLVYKGNDPSPYEVISIDDVEERHRWLEIKVQRKGGAK